MLAESLEEGKKANVYSGHTAPFNMGIGMFAFSQSLATTQSSHIISTMKVV